MEYTILVGRLKLQELEHIGDTLVGDRPTELSGLINWTGATNVLAVSVVVRQLVF